MGAIKLAANLISTTEGTANWGHLQIVNSETGDEIEVQSWSFDFLENWTQAPAFLFQQVQSHSEFTTFAPGS